MWLGSALTSLSTILLDLLILDFYHLLFCCLAFAWPLPSHKLQGLDRSPLCKPFLQGEEEPNANPVKNRLCSLGLQWGVSVWMKFWLHKSNPRGGRAMILCTPQPSSACSVTKGQGQGKLPRWQEPYSQLVVPPACLIPAVTISVPSGGAVYLQCWFASPSKLFHCCCAQREVSLTNNSHFKLYFISFLLEMQCFIWPQVGAGWFLFLGALKIFNSFWMDLKQNSMFSSPAREPKCNYLHSCNHTSKEPWLFLGSQVHGEGTPALLSSAPWTGRTDTALLFSWWLQHPDP